MKIYNNAIELIGKTPLVRLSNFEKRFNLKSEVCAKLECFNPYSVKDRVALNIIQTAENSGLIKKGDTIIEPTSGNTGIGLAFVGLLKGYNVVLVMPESMSIERRKLVAMLGAEIVLTPAEKGMQGAVDMAEKLREERGGYIADQFSNPANSQAHELTTAKEIIEDTDAKIDVFVSAFGTGGTLTGVAKELKKINKDTYIVAVEPAGSPLLTKGCAGPHKIQGIGANFIPRVLDRDIIDKVVDVQDQTAFEMARILAKTEGLLCGISSGAALAGVVEVAKMPEFENKRIVVVLPDTGERYMSTVLFDER